MAPTVGPRLSRPCSGILALYEYVDVHVIATLKFTISAILPLHHHPPNPRTPPPTPYICWPNINDFHELNCQKLVKISQLISTCQVSCTKLIDN